MIFRRHAAVSAHPVSVGGCSTDELNHFIIQHFRGLEIAVSGRITQREWYQLLSRDRVTLLRGELLHDAADGVRGALRLEGHGNMPCLGTLSTEKRRRNRRLRH